MKTGILKWTVRYYFQHQIRNMQGDMRWMRNIIADMILNNVCPLCRLVFFYVLHLIFSLWKVKCEHKSRFRFVLFWYSICKTILNSNWKFQYINNECVIGIIRSELSLTWTSIPAERIALRWVSIHLAATPGKMCKNIWLRRCVTLKTANDLNDKTR